MHARRALLKKLASVNASFEEGSGAFAGETCVETRNTSYRFRDGVCFAVVSRGKPRDGGSVLIGMRLVGWLAQVAPGAPPPPITHTWSPQACAVLWRPGIAGEEDGSVALTSATTDFTRGLTPARLQAFHDSSPPTDSSLYRRSPPPPSVHPCSRSVTRLHPQDLPPRLALVPKSPSRI